MVRGECDLRTERHLNAYVGPRNLKIGCSEPGTVRHDKLSDRDRIHDHSVAVLVEQEWLAVHEVVRRNRERSDFRKGVVDKHAVRGEIVRPHDDVRGTGDLYPDLTGRNL